MQRRMPHWKEEAPEREKKVVSEGEKKATQEREERVMLPCSPASVVLAHAYVVLLARVVAAILTCVAAASRSPVPGPLVCIGDVAQSSACSIVRLRHRCLLAVPSLSPLRHWPTIRSLLPAVLPRYTEM
ncbi:hypothetical protein ZWY2020_012265 [Hordeum vulgare]|nr:hypothetical protein ZWY2020_012265 [Hordeum vulgare]